MPGLLSFSGTGSLPQFGVTSLSLPVAADLDILFSFLAYKSSGIPPASDAAKEKYKDLTWFERSGRMFVPNFGLAILRVLITLSFGFAVHLFVRS